MNEQKVNELFEKALRRIETEGMVHQEVMFEENEGQDKMTSGEDTYLKQLKNECSFLGENWEVSLDYPIRQCNFVSKTIRKLLKKMSKVLLGNYAAAQNNINYSNKQCWEQIVLYAEALQKENEELRNQVEKLTLDIEGLKEKMPG